MPASAAASSASSLSELLAPTDSFARRHNGPPPTEQAAMLKVLGQPSLDALVDATVPSHIRRDALDLPAALGIRDEKCQAKRTLNALPHLLGPERQTDAGYLDGCRQKRNPSRMISGKRHFQPRSRSEGTRREDVIA